MDMNDQVPTVDAGQLKASVRHLADDIGERNPLRPAALAAAANYIEAQWQAQGYDVTRQWYEAAGIRCANLEVAGGRGGGILLIGAHYDTVRGSPGADDNASGVAGLLGRRGPSPH